jgi:Domain of unknown function (DUF4149)
VTVFLRWLYRLAVGAWVGTVLGVSLLVPPFVFRMLPRQQAGEVMGTIFGWYYWLGIGLGLIALVAGASLARRVGWAWERVAALALLVAMVGAAGYVRLVVSPDIMAARELVYGAPDADSAAPHRAALDALHHRAVLVNGAVLLGGVLVMLLDALREERAEGRVHDAA